MPESTIHYRGSFFMVLDPLQLNITIIYLPASFLQEGEGYKKISVGFISTGGDGGGIDFFFKLVSFGVILCTFIHFLDSSTLPEAIFLFC